MTKHTWTLAVMGVLAAGLVLATLRGSLPLVFAAVLVVFGAWALSALLQWRGALRQRFISEPTASRAPHPEAWPH